MARPNNQAKKVVDYIRNGIQHNIFNSGTKLPAENTIAQTLNVSRVTVRNALLQLEKDGFIELIHNKGAFVNSERLDNKRIIPLISQYSFTTTSFFQLYKGIEDNFSEHSFYPLLTTAGFDYKKERTIINDFFKQGFRDMMILSGFSNKNISFYHSLIHQGANIVFIDKLPSRISCDCVTCDNFQGGFEAALHLIRLGHTRIAAYSPQSIESASTILDRISGFKLALSQYGILDEELIFEWNDSAEEFAEKILPQHPDITAIFCLADFYAVPLVNYLVKNNMDISVIGYDNLKEAETNVPAITTIEQPFYQIGYYAAQLLYERIKDPQGPYRMYSLPVKLIVRDSTKKIK